MLSCGTTLQKIAFVLVFIGAIVWGLIGLFDWNLVNALLGEVPVIERIVYILVGIGGLSMLSTCKSCCVKK